MAIKYTDAIEMVDDLPVHYELKSEIKSIMRAVTFPFRPLQIDDMRDKYVPLASFIRDLDENKKLSSFTIHPLDGSSILSMTFPMVITGRPTKYTKPMEYSGFAFDSIKIELNLPPRKTHVILGTEFGNAAYVVIEYPTITITPQRRFESTAHSLGKEMVVLTDEFIKEKVEVLSFLNNLSPVDRQNESTKLKLNDDSYQEKIILPRRL